jgi:TonB family protein
MLLIAAACITTFSFAEWPDVDPHLSLQVNSQALASPTPSSLGEYQKRLDDSIGLPPNTSLNAYKKEVVSRMNVVWNRLASLQADWLAAGTIMVQFRIQPDGHVSHVEIVSNSGDQVLAAIAIRTVQETEIPPIPRAPLAVLRDGYLLIDFSFAISPPLISAWRVTYYDRNHDGIVDFELHDLPGAADTAWALSDTKFRGRYDVRLKFGYALKRERVNLPVPKNVKITKGKPPVSATQ